MIISSGPISSAPISGDGQGVIVTPESPSAMIVERKGLMSNVERIGFTATVELVGFTVTIEWTEFAVIVDRIGFTATVERKNA